MPPDPVSGILFRQPLMFFLVMMVGFLSLELSTQHVIFISTLVLNLSWSSSWTCLVLFRPCACSWQCSYEFFCTCSSLRLGMLFCSFARVRPPAVGPLFSTRCGSALFTIDRRSIGLLTRQTCRLTPCPVNSSETLVGAAVDSSLFWTCVRSPGVASREHRTHTTSVQCEALVASRAWLFTC